MFGRPKPFAAMLVAAVFSAIAAGPAAAIVGRTRDAQIPSLVTVLAREPGRAGFCSAVVVGRRAVLTAAHCARTTSDTRLFFKDDAGAPVLLDVASVVRHPDYRADAVARRERSVDLAVLITRDDLPSRFAPATIAAASAAIGARLAIAGFGLSREGDARSGGVLREADLALRPPVSTLLLWLAGDAGACTGDSGGGVFDDAGALVGIMAFAHGTGRAQCGALTQAVRVAPFAAWIADAAAR